ncbi:MAG: hypothetical protein RMA76_28755 [Deltaproteobacteria bacterium]|jgi:hypothetical protein
MNAALLALVAATTLTAGERTPAALMIVTPRNVPLGVSTALVLEGMTTAIETKTSLEISSLEQAGVDEIALRRCSFEERFGCTSRTVRASFPTARFLFVADVHPGQPARLGLTMIDLEEATRITSGGGSRAEQEDRLFSASKSTPLSPVRLERDALRAHAADVLDATFRDKLTGFWGALASIEIEVFGPGSTVVALDGRTVGAIEATTATLRDVRPGAREITLTRDDAPAFTQRVTVVLGTPARVVMPAPPEVPVLRNAALYAGLAVAAAAVGVGIYGAAATSDDTQATCLMRAGALGCPSVGALGFGYTAPVAPTTDPSAVDGGPEFLPLAVGLGVTGAVWSLSTVFFAEEEPLWWSMAVGLLGGVASSTALSWAL